MSEKLPVQTPEAAPAPSGEHLEALRSKIEAAAETAPSAEQQSQLVEQLRDKAEAAATPAERLALPVDESDDGNRPLYINRELRKLSLDQSLRSIRRKLSAPDRALSRVIHQPAIKAISEVSSKSVARPSGLLGGGVCAFLGSLAYLYLTRHIGFTYNYLLFALFFIGGFAVGLVLEVILRAARPMRTQE